MYQTLIWSLHLRYHARRMGPPFNAEDMQGDADSLVDSMGRYAQFHGNLFRGQMLVDEQKRVQLALAEPGYPLDDLEIAWWRGRRIRPAVIAAVYQIVRREHR